MLGIITGLAGILIVLERTTGWRLFKYVPAMVIMYLACALLNTVGVFGDGEEVTAPLNAVKKVALPAMIFLFLFGCDLRKIIKLGPKLLLTMAVASASLFVAVCAVYWMFQSSLGEGSWKVFGALLASWTGGSANMVAVQDILQGPQTLFGYALITDTIVYSVWLMVMFSSVAFSDRFNRFTRAKDNYLTADARDIETTKKPISVESLAIVIFGSIAVSCFSIWLGGLLPQVGDVINASAWTIIIVSVLGLVAAQTKLGEIAGSEEIATLMLFLVIGQIAAGSDFSAITQAPIYIISGLLVLVIHALLMVIYAKLTRTELFSLAVASTANIGGVASAPVVAAAYNKSLAPIGVLYGLIGSLLGTWIGLAGAQVMAGL
ncbi:MULTISPECIES: DUF819 domain-containing protein [Corynebacterium]|uniref:DUF819 family protein n=1 Tax=Corynebacterium TaxID=1716 RepID=UPI001F261E94|nr:MULTISPECIES: DUF819 family protein [Corynebacterium]